MPLLFTLGYKSTALFFEDFGLTQAKLIFRLKFIYGGSFFLRAVTNYSVLPKRHFLVDV